MKDSDGFGYHKINGEWVRYKHSGGITIGKNVEIGKYTNIDRGGVFDTVICDGTKIDSNIHIGHNSYIGKNCLLVAGTVIGGSCIIGDDTIIYMNCSIKDHVKIGKNCIIGMGSVVLHDVPDNCVYVGNPAKFLRKVV